MMAERIYQSNTNKNLQKFPKIIANFETSPKNKHSNNLIYEIDDSGKKSKEIIFKRLSYHAFELASAYPYLIDALNYICTHRPVKIHREGDPTETHYRVTLSEEQFNDYALDGYSGAGNRERVRVEMLKLSKNPISKIMPLDITGRISIRTQPINVSVAFDKGEINKKTIGLQNVKGKVRIGYSIEFFKPLWSPLFEGKFGHSWFLTPKAFNAKLYTCIERYKNLPAFMQYGELAYLSDYRRLFLYMNLHDNGIGNNLNFNALDLAKSCCPKFIDKDRNGNERLKNWYKFRQFVTKGCKLICQMGNDNVMGKVKIHPSSVYYNKNTGIISITVDRDSQEVEFKDDSDLFVIK
jgi:hypothetical protein